MYVCALNGCLNLYLCSCTCVCVCIWPPSSRLVTAGTKKKVTTPEESLMSKYGINSLQAIAVRISTIRLWVASKPFIPLWLPSPPSSFRHNKDFHLLTDSDIVCLSLLSDALTCGPVCTFTWEWRSWTSGWRDKAVVVFSWLHTGTCAWWKGPLAPARPTPSRA